jgi:YHS domain-containing protein
MTILLLRLILIIIAVYLIRRLFAYLFESQKKSGNPNNSAVPSTHMVKDPICGMYMDSRLAVRMDSRSEILYFCSEKCRTKYLEVSSDAGVSSPAG